jgi:hypothetical protein
VDLGARERDGLKEPERLRHLRLGALEELEARGRVEEEVFRLDHGAGCRRHQELLGHRSSLATDERAGVRPPLARQDGEACDRADGRQRFAAEPEGGDRLEVGIARELGRSVPGQREVNLVGAHPHAVVAHADELAPGVLEIHSDGRAAGIDGVLHQLLHDRRRALHHLAGGNLVDEMVGQTMDARHGRVFRRCCQSASRLSP